MGILMNLDELSLDELKQLQKDVERAMATLEQRRKKEALEAVKAAAAQYGMELSDVLGDAAGGKSKRKSASTGVPQYAHPDNPDLTWTGRGRRPNWIIAHEEAGGSLEDLKI